MIPASRLDSVWTSSQCTFSHRRLDCDQPKEFFPLHPPPLSARSPPFLLVDIAHRFITRYKAREVRVIEVEATDVDVRLSSFPFVSAHLSLAHRQDCHLHRYAPSLFGRFV